MKQLTGEIWKAASTDEGRPVLTHVYLDVKKKTLAASNSYILAVVPCMVEKGDESGLIPVAALKAQAKVKRSASGDGASLSVKGGVARLEDAHGAQEWKLLSGTFPALDKIYLSGNDGPVKYGINPDLLQQLGAALGSGGRGYGPLVVKPQHPLKPMNVEGPQGGFGVFMPIRLVGDHVYTTPSPDLTDDALVVEAVKAAAKLIGQRRSKNRVASAFRDALVPKTDRP